MTFKDTDDDSQSIQREAAANLANATSAKLMFDYTSNTNSSNEYVQVQVSNDGGTSWHTVGTVGASGADGTFSADISSYISAETYVHFTMPSSLDSGEVITVDNVNLSYTTFDTTTLPKQTVTELPYPRAKSHRQVPVATRVMLAARATTSASPVTRRRSPDRRRTLQIPESGAWRRPFVLRAPIAQARLADRIDPPKAAPDREVIMVAGVETVVRLRKIGRTAT